MTENTEPTERWAIVEIMGHVTRIGRVSEVQVFGATMLRVDIPTPDGGFVTEDIGGSALYRVRYVSEAVARDMVKDWGDPRPVNPADYQRPALTGPAGGDFDEVDF